MAARRFFWVLIGLFWIGPVLGWNSGVDWDEAARIAAQRHQELKIQVKEAGDCIRSLSGDPTRPLAPHSVIGVHTNDEMERRVDLPTRPIQQVLATIINNFNRPRAEMGSIVIRPVAIAFESAAAMNPLTFTEPVWLKDGEVSYVATLRHQREVSYYFDSEDRVLKGSNTAFRRKVWFLPGSDQPVLSSLCLKVGRSSDIGLFGVRRESWVFDDPEPALDASFVFNRLHGVPHKGSKPIDLQLTEEIEALRYGLDIWSGTSKVGFMVVDQYRNRLVEPDRWRMQYELELLPGRRDWYLEHQQEFDRFVLALESELGGTPTPLPKQHQDFSRGGLLQRLGWFDRF